MDWIQEGDDETAKVAYKYFMRTDPGMRDFLGPIEEIDDEFTGRRMRVRSAKIGMVRNPNPENLRDVQVYLDPLPHIRIDHAKDLQGWYQSKHNDKKGSRVRPCMTDAVLTEPYGGFCTVGCAFSLCAGELVDTPNGPKKIEDIRLGEYVWGRSNSGTEPTEVTGTTKHWKSEGYVNLYLTDNGRLKLTADHPIYSASRQTWIAAGDLFEGEILEELRFGGDGSSLSNWKRETTQEWLEESNKRQAEVRGNSQTYERGSSSSPREYVQTGEKAKITGMEAGTSRARETGYKWFQNVKEERFYGSFWTTASNAICMGSTYGDLVGRAVLWLELRTARYFSSGWERVLTGFSAFGRSLFGSERLHNQERFGENKSDPKSRLSDYIANPKTSKMVEGPRIAKIERVDEPCYVYDIQTTTQNFYQRGILVHNCYINSGHRGYRGSGLVTVPINYGDFVRKQLRSMSVSAAGYFSSFTDPFLPIEDYYGNTRAAAEAFDEVGLPVFFLSRMKYPDWAVNILRRNPYSYAQKSINTPDPDDWKKLSPGALPLLDHFEDIRRLRAAGIYVSIQVNPIIAGITSHEEIEDLFGKLAEVGTNHVIVKFVEANHPWAPAMVERITKRFGENRAAAFRDLFVENSCGAQKTITEEYRREGHQRYRRRATELGMTYATCYEYTRLPDNSWKSMGPEFTTAAQCHGHRVPMHVRVGERFAPLGACPPSGCLSCADTTEDGKGQCGSDILGQAKALRISDLRKPFDGRVT